VILAVEDVAQQVATFADGGFGLGGQRQFLVDFRRCKHSLESTNININYFHYFK